MARTTLLKTTAVGPYPSLQPAANSLDLNLQACTGSSGSNGNQFAWGDSDKLLVIVQNSDGANPYTFDITSVAYPGINRTGDIDNYSLAAGELAVFLVQRPGWLQSDGMLYVEGSNAAIKFAVVPIY